jgi:hypothetical protein
MDEWDLAEPQTKQLPFDAGIVRLTLNFVETPAGPCVRIAAKLHEGDGDGINLGGRSFPCTGRCWSIAHCPRVCRKGFRSASEARFSARLGRS